MRDGFALLDTNPLWSWPANQGAGLNRDIQLIGEFARVNGRLPGGSAEDPKERRLGQQASKLRAMFKDNTLSQERTDALNAIPLWYWSDNRGEGRDRDIQLIGEFAMVNGHLPSGSAKDPEERRLGQQAAQLRAMFKDNTLSQERTDALNAIPLWYWPANRGEGLNRDIQLIGEFARVNGHLPRASAKDPEERRLGKQASKLRMMFKDRTLSQERTDALNAIPLWYWPANRGEGRDRDIQLIGEFARVNGHLPSGSAKDPEERRLGRQASNLRAMFKNRTLSQERTDALNAIPLWWWPV